VVLAVPVGPAGLAARLDQAADEVVCLDSPPEFFAIGEFYRDFSQTTDEEVADLLARARTRLGSPGPVSGPADGAQDRDVEVRVGPTSHRGHLHLPPGARGLVVFAHGTGSDGHARRNGFVAEVLNAAGIGTLLLDLLSSEEQHDPANAFDIEMLARRVTDVTRWLRGRPETANLSIGYFGAGTGAAAALCAAATPGGAVNAVVCRGGRPELAGPWLGHVRAPTLLVVGERDGAVLELNRRALAKLSCEARLSVVPGATHLFEEPGKLAIVAELARDWFATHLTSSRAGGVTV
jgi:putative phosphoribosyl transferase